MIEIFLKPELFDIFGVFIFLFIISLTGWMLYTNKRPARLIILLLFIIGLVSFIVDGVIVYLHYLK